MNHHLIPIGQVPEMRQVFSGGTLTEASRIFIDRNGPRVQTWRALANPTNSPTEFALAGMLTSTRRGMMT